MISIELLVIAHQCFSSVCDTEGIATILRSAQTLANHLLLAHSWRLLVRLLTGIARYVEMAYIFQMLKDNDQFEFLLGQFYYMLGSQEEKINNFKNGTHIHIGNKFLFVSSVNLFSYNLNIIIFLKDSWDISRNIAPVTRKSIVWLLFISVCIVKRQKLSESKLEI